MSVLVWINEIHYDNTGTDIGEFIEIAGHAGTNLDGYRLVLYNGSTNLVYNTTNLTGIIPDEMFGRGAIAFDYPVNGIQNGSSDGIALVDSNNNVLEFISYEGSFTAMDGPAAGMTSTDIGVSEPSTNPIGQSLQLGRMGCGRERDDFVWSGPASESPGMLNQGQICPPMMPFVNCLGHLLNPNYTYNFCSAEAILQQICKLQNHYKVIKCLVSALTSENLKIAVKLLETLKLNLQDDSVLGVTNPSEPTREIYSQFINYVISSGNLVALDESGEPITLENREDAKYFGVIEFDNCLYKIVTRYLIKVPLCSNPILPS